MATQNPEAQARADTFPAHTLKRLIAAIEYGRLTGEKRPDFLQLCLQNPEERFFVQNRASSHSGVLMIYEHEPEYLDDEWRTKEGPATILNQYDWWLARDYKTAILTRAEVMSIVRYVCGEFSSDETENDVENW